MRQPTPSSKLSWRDTTVSYLSEALADELSGTIFAYGQTGTGKSHTMVGYGDQKGIIPNAFQHIFDKLSVQSDSQTTVSQ